VLTIVLLPIHVASATAALLTGTVALLVRKGSPSHRVTGRLFVYAMLTMCVSAVIAAAIKGQTINLIAGTLTGYLVLTALTTVRPASAHTRVLDLLLIALAGALGLTTLLFAVQAITSPTGVSHGYPWYPFVIFAGVGLFGAAGDLRVLRRGSLTGARRLSRHLWRMCVALWIATLSFFTVRSRVAMIVPGSLVTPALQFTPIILVVLTTVYWLWRVRIRAHYLRMIQRAV
jgi:uncharacterized membrane protein